MSRSTHAADTADDWELLPESGVRVCDASPPGARAYDADAEAGALLLESPHIVPLLDEACDKLRELFGADAIFVLQRFDDPESPLSDPMLLFIIRTSLDPQRADTLLKRFDEEWWIDKVDRTRGSLEFIVRYTA